MDEELWFGFWMGMGLGRRSIIEPNTTPSYTPAYERRLNQGLSGAYLGLIVAGDTVVLNYWAL